MEITLLWFLCIALIVLGLAGTVLPVLPGTLLVWGGIVLGAWIDNFSRVGTTTVLVISALAILAWGLEYLAGFMGAQKAGASKQALLGAALGTVAGLFMGLVGVLFMPLFGAAVGEYPMAVSPLPATLITRLVEAFPNTFAPGNSGALALKAIPLCEKNTLHRWMSNAKFSEQNKSVTENALNVAMLMSTCKACGEIVDVRAIDADSHGYRASCQCGYGWRWRFHSAQKKRTGRYAYGSEQRSFEADGSDAMAFEIDVLGGQA